MTFLEAGILFLVISETTGFGRGFTDQLLQRLAPFVGDFLYAFSRSGEVTPAMRNWQAFVASRQFHPQGLPYYWPRPGVDGADIGRQRTPEEVEQSKKNPHFAGFTEAPHYAGGDPTAVQPASPP
jgi:hypothetical protein